MEVNGKPSIGMPPPAPVRPQFIVAYFTRRRGYPWEGSVRREAVFVLRPALQENSLAGVIRREVTLGNGRGSRNCLGAPCIQNLKSLASAVSEILVLSRTESQTDRTTVLNIASFACTGGRMHN